MRVPTHGPTRLYPAGEPERLRSNEDVSVFTRQGTVAFESAMLQANEGRRTAEGVTIVFPDTWTGEFARKLRARDDHGG